MFKNRIMNFLAQGVPAKDIPSIIGISASRYNEITQKEDFKLELANRIVECSEQPHVEEVALHTKYVAAEHSLIKRVMELAIDSDLKDCTGALRVVADRQLQIRKLEAEAAKPPEGSSVRVVHLTMPTLIVNQFNAPSLQLNSNNEIISVNGKSLAPLSSEAIMGRFGKDKERMPLEIEKATEGDNHEYIGKIQGTTGSSAQALSPEVAEWLGAL